jgi:hypothetical protein
VFDRVFSSWVINENVSVVLDGTRIPQIRLPGFLDFLLRHLKVTVPMPFYTAQSGYLFICESADTLLAAVNAIRKNDVLPKTEVWQNLSQSSSDLNSFSLFYSLDRSVPFFLKGNTMIASLLRFYRQGLARLNLRDSLVTVNLSVISAPGGGLELFPGYPVDLGGRSGREVYGVGIGRGGSRLLLTRGNFALALNPQDNQLYQLEGRGPLHALPAEGFNPQNSSDPAAWVVDSQGVVSLVNANMETLAPFPLITGIRLSAAPGAFGRRLYLPGGDGVLYTVDQNGSINSLPLDFEDVLLSPPSFFRQGRNEYMALYPKSFFGEIWLSGTDGVPRPSWPVSVSGIAFGSPLVFAWNDTVYAAFVTQAGTLHVFTESGQPAEQFPKELEGVFYIQPVFDGQALWLLSSQGNLYQISMEGEVLSQNISGLRAEEGSITVVDADGDREGEIFITGSGNALYGYTRNFISLDGFPLPVWGRPCFSDLNGDGRMECAGVGMDNKLYRWQFR